MAQTVKNQLAMQETQIPFLGWEVPLDKGMGTHSSILDWKIPWTEETNRLQSMGVKESGITERLIRHAYTSECS